MDVQNITWGDGLVLTDDIMTDRFGILTGHQITFKDHAENFVWGADQDMDGHGIQAVRHINGTFTDARYFQDGDDDVAIQAALDWISATTEASGIVIIPTRATQYSITTTINVPSNVGIFGMPGAELSVDFNGPVFNLAANRSYVHIHGIHLDCNARTGAYLLSTTQHAHNIVVEKCRMGDPEAPTTTFGDAHMVNFAGNATWVQLIDCEVYGGGGLFKNGGSGDQVRIKGCEFDDAGTHASATKFIDLLACKDTVIENCRVQSYNATSDGFVNIVYIGSLSDRTIVRNCWFDGCKEEQILVFESVDVEIGNNRCSNGNIDGSKAIIGIDDDSQRAWVHDNFATCVSSMATTKNAKYGIWIGNGGASPPNHVIVENNFLECLIDSSTIPGSNQYYCITAGLKDDGVNTYRKGNRFLKDQIGRAELAGGAANEDVTVNGFIHPNNGGTPSDRHLQYKVVMANASKHAAGTTGGICWEGNTSSHSTTENEMTVYSEDTATIDAATSVEWIIDG